MSDEPTKEQLFSTQAGSYDTDRLRFTGLRGDASMHLDDPALRAGICALPAAPREVGMVDLLVARGPHGERSLPREAMLTVQHGMPGDRWFGSKYGPEYQLATIRTDFARLVANGQPLELHGDNLFLTLDVSSDNLPAGSRLALGQAIVRVTEVAHNGCKKWVQRFGLAAMQANLAPDLRSLHLRGIYLQVVHDGLVRVGDRVQVMERGRQ